MNLNSPLFDRIRVRPADNPEEKRASERACDHAGCGLVGAFRAPKGRGREGEFYYFCLDHVRAYNQTYNYFAGMKERDVAAFVKDAATGHRPTWKLGTIGAKFDPQKPIGERGYVDPFDILRTRGFGAGRRAAPEKKKPRASPLALAAFEKLSLEPGTEGPQIKARYKELVKRLHPDANGGDRSREAFLQEVIKAYGTLKSLGFC